VNLLLTLQRLDDALLIASTCLKLDPYNRQGMDVVRNLTEIKKRQAKVNPNQRTLSQLEQAVRDNPTNFQAAFNLAAAYLQVQQPDRAAEELDRVLNHPRAGVNEWRVLIRAYGSFGNLDGVQRTVTKLEHRANASPPDFTAAIALVDGYRDLLQYEAATRTLDQVLNHPQADANAVLQVALQYAALTNYQRVEVALDRLTRLEPSKPEHWYDLAGLRAVLGKSQEALPALRQAVELSAQRLKQDPKALDLLAKALQDPRFESLRQLPEFKQITAPR
jgi:tetratricopeptide (TPR) repeat protein